MKKKHILPLFVAAMVILGYLMLVSEPAEADVSAPFNDSVNGREGANIFALMAAVCAYSIEKDYKVEPFLEIGKTFGQSDHTLGGAGCRVGGKYEYTFGLMGEGYTKNGHQDSSYYGSVSRIISPGWNVPFMKLELKSRFGLAYTPEAQLVGTINYVMGLILERKNLSVEIGRHMSSGGIFEENAGVDGALIQLRF